MRILNATIECLCEVGYHQTSTVLVTAKAGVSRGAMLHHFPSKADLILATFEHIRLLRKEAHDGALGSLKTDRERFLNLIDALWTTVQTPAGIARIEIMVGSRSDPEVGPEFAKLQHMYVDAHRERVYALVEGMGIKDRKKLDAFVQLYIAATRSLAMDALSPGPRGMADIRGAIALLKEFQVHLLNKLLEKKA